MMISENPTGSPVETAVPHPGLADVRDKVTQELTAAFTLVAVHGAAGIRHEIDTFRQSLDAGLKQLSASAATAVAVQDVDLQDLVQRVAASAEEYADSRSHQVADELLERIAGLQQQLDQQSRQGEEAATTIATLQAELAELQSAVATHTRLAAAARAECEKAVEAQMEAEAAHRKVQDLSSADQQARMTAERDLEALRGQLEIARGDVARISADHAAEVAAHRDTVAAFSAARIQLHTTEGQRQEIAALLEASGAHLASLRQSYAEQSERCRDLEAQLQAAPAVSPVAGERSHSPGNERGLGADAGPFEGETTASGDSSFAARHGHDMMALVSLSLERMLSISRDLATGTSTDEILDVLVGAMGIEFSRVLLFAAEPDGLAILRQNGFTSQVDRSHVEAATNLRALLDRAMVSGESEVVLGDTLATTWPEPFHGTPAVALIIPLVVNGKALAVLYADDSDQPNRDLVSPDLRVKFAELVCQQARPLLERTTAEQRVSEELGRHASSLVTHLQSTHAADLGSGMAAAERLNRLSQNLDYARRLYRQRAETHGRQAMMLFDDRVRTVLDAQPVTSFARDLAEVLGSPDRDSETTRVQASATQWTVTRGGRSRR